MGRSKTDAIKMGGSDISTGYAADNFLSTRKPVDPWNEQCFVSVIDVVVNHSSGTFPHPTPSSLIRSQRLPWLFRELMKRKLPSDSPDEQTPLLTSFTAHVSSDLSPTEDELRNTLKDFISFALVSGDKLDRWISFQESIRPKHIIGMPGEVQDFTARYWSQQTAKELPLGLVKIDAMRLRYAFDVFFRGRQYIELFANTGGLYFPHPLRLPLFASRKEDYRAMRTWSWGGVVAVLISSKRFSRRADEVADLVGTIKSTVIANRLSWYDRPSEDRLKETAAAIDLPAKLRRSFLEVVQRVSKLASGPLDGALGTFGLITLITELLFIHLKAKDRYVPGKVGKLSVMRGYIEWPGSDYYRRHA